MEYRKFCELLRQGESEIVDFKLECNAFRRARAANAELLKDIVAMANNGYVSSYIVVGVSDDRKGFRSVLNDSLTDDNLQRLCRDSIQPVPAVKLTRQRWPRAAAGPHGDKTFVVIQIGPHPRQCFSFSRDLIDWTSECCHRKHEVWIRRGATSDLAGPEEVRRLLEGKAPIGRPSGTSAVDYTRVPRRTYASTVTRDLIPLVRAAGGQAYANNHVTGWVDSSRTRDFHFQLRFRLAPNADPLILKVLVVERCATKEAVTDLIARYVTVQHGLLLISVGNVSPQATRSLDLALREQWGWFCVADPRERMPRHDPTQSFGMLTAYDEDRFCVACSSVRSSDHLHRMWEAMRDSIATNPEIRPVIERRQKNLKRYLIDWNGKGCPTYNEKMRPQYQQTMKAYLPLL